MTKQEALNRIKELENYVSQKIDDLTFEIEMIPIKNLSTIDFEIGKYPVTNKQWRFIYPNHAPYEADDLPVTDISFNDIKNYIKELNLVTGEYYRLPSEYEWLVCATIDGTLYSGSNNIDDVAWFSKNCFWKMPVKTKRPNALGIYHMSGNVWEVCEEEGNIVLRGGSWDLSAESCRVSYRSNYDPDYRDYDLGFRLVKSS